MAHTDEPTLKLRVHADVLDTIMADTGIDSYAELARLIGVSTRTIKRVRLGTHHSEAFLAGMQQKFGERYPFILDNLTYVTDH